MTQEPTFNISCGWGLGAEILNDLLSLQQLVSMNILTIKSKIVWPNPGEFWKPDKFCSILPIMSIYYISISCIFLLEERAPTTFARTPKMGKQAWKFGKFRETIHRYCVCTPCGNDEIIFRFPQQILAETICKQC